MAKVQGLNSSEYTAGLNALKTRIKDKASGSRYLVDGAPAERTVNGLVALVASKGKDGVKVSLAKVDGVVLSGTTAGKDSGLRAALQLAAAEGIEQDVFDAICKSVVGGAAPLAADKAAEDKAAELAAATEKAAQRNGTGKVPATK